MYLILHSYIGKITVLMTYTLLVFGYASPGGPSPCPCHYNTAFDYYAATALPSAHWHFRALHNAGKAAWEFPCSNVRDVLATLRSLLHAGQIRDNAYREDNRQALCHPILGRVYQPLSPIHRDDVSDTDFSRLHRSQDSSVNRIVAASSRAFINGHQTSLVADQRRLPHSPCPLSRNNSFKEQSNSPIRYIGEQLTSLKGTHPRRCYFNG